MPVAHFDPRVLRIEEKVSNTVADSKALQVGFENGCIARIGSVVLVDLVCEVGHVDSGVRLAGDIEIIGLKLGELLVPGQDSGQVVLS